MLPLIYLDARRLLALLPVIGVMLAFGMVPVLLQRPQGGTTGIAFVAMSAMVLISRLFPFDSSGSRINVLVGTLPVTRRQVIGSRYTLALLIVAAPGAWLAWRAAPWRQWAAQYATATGEQRELALDDGSRVVLDTASAIDVLFSGELRAIRLRAGAILAITAPDPQGAGGAARPFIVLTGQGQARALGTRFAVRQAGASSHVAVFEGAVALTPRSGAAHTLQAGEQARFSADGVVAAQPLPPNAGQWARGVLAVEDMRLADFAVELARYRPGILQCDPAVADLRITGAFQLADTDAVLRNIEQLLPVQARQRTRYWVTLVPR